MVRVLVGSALASSTELHGTLAGKGSRQAATIKILPDEIFREIFALCMPDPYTDKHMRIWQRLMQVCKRWREIIYASPRYLNLHLCCTNGTPFRKNLGYWPAFPISIVYHLPNHDFLFPLEDDDHDIELIAALKRPDRVHRINLDTTTSVVEDVVAVMQVPFPVMTHLEFSGPSVEVPVLPGGFLGRSAPCLQHLHLNHIPFPELPTLLLSARDLVSLQLDCIPLTGYISPEAMVVGLAGLTRLRTLRIEIQFPIPPSEQTTRRTDSPMMAVLPALTQFEFRGESEYLEPLVAQIDTPRVEDISIEYSVEEIQASQLSRFIGRTLAANLKLAQFKGAEATFLDDVVSIKLEVEREGGHPRAGHSVTILGRGSDSQILFMTHVLSQLDAMLSKVEIFSVGGIPVQFGRQDNMDRTEWLELLHLFPAVEGMFVYMEMTRHIACALEDIAEELVTEVLPALHLICLEDDSDDDSYDNDDNDSDCEHDSYFRYKTKPLVSTDQFLSLRNGFGHPVTIVKSEDEFFERFTARQRCEEKIL